MSKKKFTILTSSHNQYEYQTDWINSILAQEYRPLQVIFVDDFSSDLDYLNKQKYLFKERDIQLITYRTHKRYYCGSSYRQCYDLSTGDYIGILDADDALIPNAVSFIMDCYNKSPELGFIYTQFNICDLNLKLKKQGFCKAPIEGLSLLQCEKSAKMRHCFSHWRTFKKTNLTRSVFSRGLKASVDKFMGYRLEELFPGAFVNKSCYRYRSGVKNSVTRSHSSIKIWDNVRKEAFQRRKKHKIKPYPVIEIDLP